MSKVITFSRVFPAYHPKAGQPTYFVDKIWYSLFLIHEANIVPAWREWQANSVFPCEPQNYSPKHHTIRSGKRWKAGDKFSPRVWSGKPYNSKQIIIAPDIEIKQVWDFRIDFWEGELMMYLSGNDDKMTCSIEFVNDPDDIAVISKIAANDGLELQDLLDWFQVDKITADKPFVGQIICWSDQVKY